PVPTTTDINTLSLHDALPIYHARVREWFLRHGDGFATCPIVEGALVRWIARLEGRDGFAIAARELEKLAADPRHAFWPDALPYRSEEHTSELQSRENLVCRLL